MMSINQFVNRERRYFLLVKDTNVGDQYFEDLETLLKNCKLNDFELDKAVGHFNMSSKFPLRVVSRNDKDLCYQVFRIYNHENDMMRQCTVYFDSDENISSKKFTITKLKDLVKSVREKYHVG